MSRARLVSLAFGALFGFLLAWGRLSDPDVIRGMLLLDEAYVFLIMGSAIAVGFTGVRLVKRVRRDALVTGETLAFTAVAPERRHLTGSAMFGVGWAISCACPGPLLAQLGQGVAWGWWTFAGVATGVLVYLRRNEPEASPEHVDAGGLQAPALASAPE